MKKTEFSEYIPMKNIELADAFWKKQTLLIKNEVIPYQYEALHDRIPGAEKSYSIENFIKAGKIAQKLKNEESVPTYPTDKWCYDDGNCDENAFHGWVFQDSDVYKWLEAVGFSLMLYPDFELEKKADEVIDIVAAAQLENGYLDTLFIINDRAAVFTNLRDRHELYCFGHLLEAAVCYYKATGKRKLLDVAIRFADLVCDTFGEDKIKGYPGHEIAEMALVKLYDMTNEEKYLRMAEFFIEERGKKPYYFDIEQGKTTVNDNYHYNQAHRQPKLQTEATGHAVRGVYLYSGMADVAKRCKDEELYTACKKLAGSIINEKLFITGGIGSTVDGEAFSYPFDLPNDLCYNETCASIGLIFFLRRMLEISPDAVFGDTIERALYNTVLSGMSLDGKSFLYVNPLEVLPLASHCDSRKRHIRPTRQKWFGCACCPPNLARMISSVGEYAFTENESTVYIHQYIGAVIKTDKGRIEISSTYPENGKVKITLRPERSFTLALRIPSWADSFTIGSKYSLRDGYAYIPISDEAVIDIEFSMSVKMMKCSNKVRANIGKAAITKGPFVYCIEEADNGKDLHRIKLQKNGKFTVNDDSISVNALKETESKSLYSEYSEEEYEEMNVKLIPYYKWGNRGEGEMQVYIRI